MVSESGERGAANGDDRRDGFGVRSPPAARSVAPDRRTPVLIHLGTRPPPTKHV